MEKDLDSKLYSDYFKGKKEIFDLLYSKYKSKIEFFIFNFVKDYQIAEDIAQDVFIYVFQNQPKEEYSFKSYLYLVAKSRALSYLKNEKNRESISEKYLNNKDETTEQDILELITNQETKKELIREINKLDDKYKNAIYLTQIEELSYKETSEILGETVQNIKNYVHRGKKKLRNSLLKKKIDSDNNVLKTILIVISITIILTGITYASITIYEKVWKEPQSFNSLEEKIEYDREFYEKDTEEQINKSKIISTEEAISIASDIFKNLEIGQNITNKNIKINSESFFGYFEIKTEEYEISLSPNGTLYTLVNKNYNFNAKDDIIDENTALKLSNKIINSLNLNNNYSINFIEYTNGFIRNDSYNIWMASYYETINDLKNKYNCINIFFSVIDNNLIIERINKLDDNWEYQNNEVIITKERAIEIAKNVDRKISILDVTTIDAELDIERVNSFVYAQEETLGKEDEFREEVIDGVTHAYRAYSNEKILRTIWNVKISYNYNESNARNSKEFLGRYYYVDTSTGEIIGGSWGKIGY